MVKLTESATYSPTIFRLETTTPVAGGAVVLDSNDDPVQGHANAQAQLLANRTKYLKEITDTLGTASTANVTTSSTDTTANRVLKVGDFGLGGGAPLLVTDANAVPTGGSFCVLNTPFTNGPTAEFYALYSILNGSAAASQFAVSYATGAAAYFRTRTAGTWSGWTAISTASSGLSITTDVGSLGYNTGSGGTVTQATSKATPVTLNKPSGQITTTGDALAANTSVSFTLTNNRIAANDIPKVVIKSGATAGAYVVQVDAVAAGSCRISIRNMTAGSLSETLVLQFNIEKGAVA